jgi:Carboxypeptidase regulatory-like domain
MRRLLSPSSPLALASTLLAVACAPAAQRAYVAPSYETIVSTTEQHEANPPSHIIYIENHSTVDVRVFAIQLTNCENVNVRCGVQQMNLRVPAEGRTMAVRIGPNSPTQRWNYSFGFSWHADTSYGKAALNALASAGDTAARVRLAAIQHRDSLRRAETGPHYNELSKSDFTVLAPKIAAMRADPESLVVVPGEHVSIERIRLILLDNQGMVLGQTRWVSSMVMRGAIELEPPYTIVARRLGRGTIRFRLADEPRKMIATPLPELEFPVIVAYPPDPNAPVFEGRALDAESKAPLACARIALEDSSQNVVARDRSTSQGTFSLIAPRPGTYRVRVETPGWAPVYGPSELANDGDEKQHEYLVKFSEQMLMGRFHPPADGFEDARPTALSMRPEAKAPRKGQRSSASQPIVSGVTLGGSESLPILGIIGKAPPGTSWMQFVVDSTGHVDTSSITLSAGADPKSLASVQSVLPRLRFSPARDAGKPVCELLRMQVNFNSR